jgi:hypothetical protein
MKTYPMHLYRIFLAILVLAVGCADHFYRTDDTFLTLYLRAPEAHSVQIAASYDGFVPKTAKRIDNGLWRTTLPRNLSFSYFYLVDGQPFVPDCDMMESDDFGRKNCIYSPPS